MAKRITKPTLTSLVPKNEAQLTELIQQIILNQTRREMAVAERDAAIATFSAKLEEEHHYDRTINQADIENARNVELLEAWAADNKAEFGALKSTTRAGATFGWRLGSWGTKLKSKVTWARVVEALRALITQAANEKDSPAPDAETVLTGQIAARFLRIVEQPDKEAMIAARDKAEDVAVLEHAGVLVEQNEFFFFEPAREGQASPDLSHKA